MWRTDSLGKTLMLGKTEGKRRRGWQEMRWLDSITDSADMNLSKLRDGRRQWAPHSSTLAWKIPWMEEPGRRQSMGSWRVGHDCTTSFSFHFHALEKEMATHSSVLAWGIPGTGLHRVGHGWSDLAVAVVEMVEDRGALCASGPWGCKESAMTEDLKSNNKIYLLHPLWKRQKKDWEPDNAKHKLWFM